MERFAGRLNGQRMEFIIDNEMFENGGSFPLCSNTQQTFSCWQCIKAHEHTGWSLIKSLIIYVEYSKQKKKKKFNC